MSINMTSNFVKLLAHFRRQDLADYSAEHERLFHEAKRTNDHSQVTAHYYSVMSAVIDEYFSGNFHFVPPLQRAQRLDDALRALHVRIAAELGLEPGRHCADIGCGIGTVIRELAHTGADLTGLTIAPNEVKAGNAALAADGVAARCRLLEADCRQVPLADASLDAAYAIYALKYCVRLGPVLAEVARCLRPGGRLVVYDLMKTDAYDEDNPKHRSLVEGLEFACGMPALHYRTEMVSQCAAQGLRLVKAVDLARETGKPYYYCFAHSHLFMWMMRSRAVRALIRLGQALRLLPPGFHDFHHTFLAGTVTKIVDAGRAGILQGAEILVFEKTQ